MASVTVLIPTLNEADNVDYLLERLLEIRSSCGIEFGILVVDSASDDGTCKKVESWQHKEPVELLCLDYNIGLAGAVIAGANYTKSTYVVVMDADLSHPPSDIPNLLKPLLEGRYDMVIGSRYAVGAEMVDWPLKRRFSSKIATFPALFFCDVKDPLAGFFAVKRERITGLKGDVPGFKIGLAILAQYGQDLRTLEIPIQFRDRDYGESKMGRAVVLDYCKQLLMISSKKMMKRK